MEPTPTYKLKYDPTACDWSKVIDEFYLNNPGARGQVTLILKPKVCIKKGLKNASFCNEKTAESIIKKRLTDKPLGGAWKKDTDD